MSDKSTKYILTGYDFDHDVREWVKPAIFDDFDAACDEMRSRWEYIQNNHVLESWEGYDGYEEHNYFECDNDGNAMAVSQERIHGASFPYIMTVAPVRDECIVFVAEEVPYECEECGCEVYWLTQVPNICDARVAVLSDMSERATELISPWVKMWDDGAYLCDDEDDHELTYEMVIPALVDLLS